MDKNIDIVLKKIKEENGNSCDLYTKIINIRNHKVAYVFYESVSNDDKISNFLGKSLSIDVRSKKDIFKDLFESLQNTIPNSKIKTVDNYDDLYYHLFSGFTCLFIEGYSKCIAIETKAKLDRAITESSSEPVLKGPKDSFNENFISNIGLIRKRIKDKNLVFEEIKIGRRTKTKVAVTYIKDIADDKKVKKLKKQLEDIDIDGIIDSSYIRELLYQNHASLMPKVVSTERPDLTCQSLLNGKVALIVENAPYILIYPAVFSDFFQSPEDYYLKPINSSFTRILRYIAFFIAILMPAFYVALTTYNMEVLPNQLLISFAIQKEGVPFPTIVEVLILIISYEILREADTRKPQIIGASISIVGALILGEAAVSAGIISPIVVIIISISAVAGMAFNDPDVINAIRFWRIMFMFAAGIFGIIGIFITGIIFTARLASYYSLDTPYLSPISPMSFKDLKSSLLRFTQSKLKNRSLYLNDKNIKRLDDNK